jgi:AcrR family transcriptional regulator
MSRRNSRLAIIEAAVDLFASKGFERATVEEVATQAKLAKGTVFYNFKSKEDIFHAIVERNTQAFAELVNARSAITGSSAEQMAAAYDAAFEFFQTNNSFCSLLISELGRVHSRWNLDSLTLLGAFRHRLEEIFTEGQKNREFRADIDARDVGLIVFFLAAINSLAKRLSSEYSIESRLAEKSKLILLKGLKAD